MKKLIAILLTFTIVTALGIPAFASDSEAETPQVTEEEISDIIQSDEFIENGDYIIVEDEEDE